MNRIIFTALAATSAVAAIAAAAPASAQSGGYGGNGYGNNGYGNGNVEVRADQLRMRLQAGVQSGAITRAEAMPLREQLRELTRLETLYARDGISFRERADLQQRIGTLRQGIRMAERSGDSRYGQDDRDGRWQDRDGRWHEGDDDRYGNARPCPPGLAKKNNGCLPPGQVGRDDRYDRDDRDDRYGNRDVDSRYDRNNDGWDDRDSNRDGRWDVDSRYDSNRDGYDDRDLDRDGRWDNDQGYQQSNGRGVVGQILDRVTGNNGLRVGQRASANLGSVPYAYRSQYRDSDNVYYRSDGRNIYQIDARTQTVVRIYAMNR
ncbi:MAG TPA: hypothetical protein VE891_10520 [Allosphingosinicella sp.]|nr:hypothetical protein [Allosphingosinicella sp.]